MLSCSLQELVGNQDKLELRTKSMLKLALKTVLLDFSRVYEYIFPSS